MKHALLLSLILSGAAQAQVYDVDTLMWGGNSSNRVNLVMLADGYTNAELNQFGTDAQTVVNAIFQAPPYNRYQDYFNVFAVKVVSNESGASHSGVSSDNACGSQPIATVDNYFGSAFDCGGGAYHRLLCATKSYLIPGVLASNVPNYDVVLVVVNTPYYGGAGGSCAVFSMHSLATEIAIHETGHTFANLADEYWAGAMYETDSRPNMTSNSDISTVKWSEWVGTDNVGLYPHSGDPAWFKPVTAQCKMELLGTNYPFCPVCAEAHVLEILHLTLPYDSFTPSNNSAISPGADIAFSVTPVLPDPNTLSIHWELDGALMQSGTSPDYTLPYAAIPDGSSQLTAVFLDTTDLVRAENHATINTHTIVWNISKGNGNLGMSTQELKASATLFPNPGRQSSLVIDKESDVTGIEIVDATGKRVWNSDIPQHSYTLNADALHLQPGLYRVHLLHNTTHLGSLSWLVQ